jgi:hypothetical protein
VTEYVEAIPVLALAGLALRWRQRRLRWRVRVEYEDRGAILYAKRGGRQIMVARVSFMRTPELCKHPDVEFDEQLADALSRTRSRCSVLNATERSQRDR